MLIPQQLERPTGALCWWLESDGLASSPEGHVPEREVEREREGDSGVTGAACSKSRVFRGEVALHHHGSTGARTLPE